MTNNPFGIEPRIWRQIQNLCLLDNLLMQTALDGFIPGVQLILRIILDFPDLEVTELSVQKVLPNLISRDVVLDVKAVDTAERLYNIEVQRSDSGAVPLRPRYHSALMDVQFLQKGMQVTDLPETYVVFITENDVLGAGAPLYHIDRVVQETGKLFGDRAHIVYANAAYEGTDELGCLMADFRARNPDEMYYSVLADRVRTVKSNRKGAVEMSQVLNQWYKVGYDEGHGVGYDEGHGVGYDEGRDAGSARMLLRMMVHNHWTLEQAMETAGIPMEMKPHYKRLIENCAAR